MVLSTIGVAADVTPSVIETFFSHFIHRKQLRQKPTAHISYHEGLRLIRQFLSYASEHTVEDVQAFTGQWVPCPTWVVMDEVLIPDNFITQAASLIQSQLGPRGIEKVGGKEWWQWRRPEIPFKAEWIEMKTDFNERKAAGKQKSERIILYVHGGAYYFGSTGEHRYQMQRHARKLKAQLLAPKYRLAPQFPFPCGLHDCIASYLYLIQDHHPSTILLGGDSAGGGMVVSMLVTLRDQGIPLPAGAILLSPWVDLTHSFPSVAGDGDFDYIPANGFHHKPSMAWPPPNAADMQALRAASNSDHSPSSSPPTSSESHSRSQRRSNGDAEVEAGQGISAHSPDPTPSAVNGATAIHTDTSDAPGTSSIANAKPGQPLSIELDGKVIEIQDQIQMYTANHLLAHPLVSPVMQSSLGGLPPLLIQVGGGELLKDEQVYLAHKAANPSLYTPPDSVLDEYDPERQSLNKYGPTRVQLQVWDDLCHVPHTLSFTRPAKFMYRSVAQFGAWALAHAQGKAMTIMDDDELSVISTDESEKSDKDSQESENAETSRSAPTSRDGAKTTSPSSNLHKRAHTISSPTGEVGRAGDPIPHFVNHMIRQRVDRHGIIYPLPPPAQLSSLQVASNSIGVIKPGPVRKWIAKKAEWDTKYAKEKRHVQKARLKEMRQGYDGFADDTPPPTALAGRIQDGMVKQKLRKGKSWALSMWSGWGSKHDQSTIDRKKKISRQPTQAVVLPEAGKSVGATENPAYTGSSATSDAGGDGPVARNESTDAGVLADQEQTKVEGSENTYLSANNARPHNGVVAYPFKLRNMPNASASTATLDSSKDHVSPIGGIHGTYQSSVADDEKSTYSRVSAPLTPEGFGGAGEKEVGGHEWLVGRENENTSRSGSRSMHGASGVAATGYAGQHSNERAPSTNQAYELDAEGNEIGGHNWIVGRRKKENSQPSSHAQASEGEHYGAGSNSANIARSASSEPLAKEEDVDRTGHEIGGHIWIMNGSKKGKGKASAMPAAATAGHGLDGVAEEESHADAGGPEAKSAGERPPAHTFVTAREHF